jgi:hypothetical protein
MMTVKCNSKNTSTYIAKVSFDREVYLVESMQQQQVMQEKKTDKIVNMLLHVKILE